MLMAKSTITSFSGLRRWEFGNVDFIGHMNLSAFEFCRERVLPCFFLLTIDSHLRFYVFGLRRCCDGLPDHAATVRWM
jgi:hypothetical protein